MDFISVFAMLFIFAVAMVIAAIVSTATSRQQRRRTFSSDGHRVPRNQDLTCNRYGHEHEVTNEFGRRYVVHEDPEEGYVVLNGIKRKLEDCKYL